MVIALNSQAGGASLLALGAVLVVLTLGACGSPATHPLAAGGTSGTKSHQPSSNEPVPSPSAVGGSGTPSGRPPTNLPKPSNGSLPPVNPVHLPSTDPEFVRLLKGLPATIAGHAKTLNTPHEVRYADGSSITVQTLVEASGDSRLTANDVFKRLTHRQYQVNAQNAPGARVLWFTAKTRLPFDPSGNAKTPPFNRYAAVVAASGGDWIFEVQAGDAGTLTELMRALRLTTT